MNPWLWNPEYSAEWDAVIWSAPWGDIHYRDLAGWLAIFTPRRICATP